MHQPSQNMVGTMRPWHLFITIDFTPFSRVLRSLWPRTNTAHISHDTLRSILLGKIRVMPRFLSSIYTVVGMHDSWIAPESCSEESPIRRGTTRTNAVPTSTLSWRKYSLGDTFVSDSNLDSQQYRSPYVQTEPFLSTYWAHTTSTTTSEGGPRGSRRTKNCSSMKIYQAPTRPLEYLVGIYVGSNMVFDKLLESLLPTTRYFCALRAFNTSTTCAFLLFRLTQMVLWYRR